METAKVDIRKLQFLNDRINQTIDALNQVRLSVHGLSHTAAQPSFGQPGLAATGMPLGQPGYPQAQVFPQGQPYPQGFVPGLSHSSMPFGAQNVNPAFGISPLQAGFGLPLQSGFGIAGQPGYGQPSPWGVGGLSHTGGEGFEPQRTAWQDPLFAARVQQTFPYAQYALPPVVTLY